MQINISKLNQTKGGTDFSYNQLAESAISNAICYHLDLINRGQTEGYDPRYDVIFNHSKIEIKITGKRGTYLEFAKGTGAESGIFTTQSDLYLVVGPGMDKGNSIIKAKLYRTAELRHWITHMINNHPEEMVEFKADHMGPGSKGFNLDVKAVDDLYILGFHYVPQTGNQVFDTHNVVLPSAYALNNISKYIG